MPVTKIKFKGRQYTYNTNSVRAYCRFVDRHNDIRAFDADVIDRQTFEMVDIAGKIDFVLCDKDIKAGDQYTVEYIAEAKDDDGKKYYLFWQFIEIFGQRGLGPKSYNWHNVYAVAPRHKSKKGPSTIEHDSITYIIPDDAYPSDRLFDGSYSPLLQDGDKYIAEYLARAIGGDDKEYLAIWQFEETKGQEVEDMSDYNWDNARLMSLPVCNCINCRNKKIKKTLSVKK